MILEIMQQTLTKYSPEVKLWDQSLYNGAQVILIDGPVGTKALSIANSASRTLQYNHPGLNVSVINALADRSLEFVIARLQENCDKDLVSIVVGANVTKLQSLLKSEGFQGKVKTVFLYNDLGKYCQVRVAPIVNADATDTAKQSRAIIDAIHHYLQYFQVTKTMRYSTLFGYTVDGLSELEKQYLFSQLNTDNDYSVGIARLLRLLSSVRGSTFCKKLYFSTKIRYSFAINVADRNDDSIGNEIVVRLAAPAAYKAFEIFQGIQGKTV